MHTLLISDLHLSEEHTASMAAFLHFIGEQAIHAEVLYILGDLFEYWAGDDDINDPFHQKVIEALSRLAANGTQLYIMRGNRDLLMGKSLMDACSATALTDFALIDLYGTATLLCHGDTLCTDDIAYQAFRKQVHSLEFQTKFLEQPLSDRKKYIEQLRRDSNREKKNKKYALMDVNPDAVATLLREYRYPRLIHGHTHRTDCHLHTVDGHSCQRWVLGDWENGINALRVDASGIRWAA
jgi:UDP-2,3-diacylglucosamine hydrolase